MRKLIVILFFAPVLCFAQRSITIKLSDTISVSDPPTVVGEAVYTPSPRSISFGKVYRSATPCIPPVPDLTGSISVLEGSTGNVYTTDEGMTDYVWAVSAGGTITVGGGTSDNTATITWNTAGAQTVSVSYTDECAAESPTVLDVTVNPVIFFTSVQPATIDQVSITFQTLTSDDVIWLDWGDGSAPVQISGTTDQTKTSAYVTNNTTYNIRIWGDLNKVKKFYIYEPTVASLDLNDISDYMTALQYLYLRDVATTGNKELPSTLTYLYLLGNNINWTYSGALPTGLTYLYLNSINLNWTYSGALPTGLTYLLLAGNNINWTYSGALPTGLTYLVLNGINLNWTYSGALPTGLTYLLLSGINLNWTGLDIGNNGNITTLTLTNYRIAKMSSTDMVTLLTQMTNRTGSLPSGTVTINDFADFAEPLSEVTDAVILLKSTKSITNVILGE